jgi:hypothetical protein
MSSESTIGSSRRSLKGVRALFLIAGPILGGLRSLLVIHRLSPVSRRMAAAFILRTVGTCVSGARRKKAAV